MNCRLKSTVLAERNEAFLLLRDQLYIIIHASGKTSSITHPSMIHIRLQKKTCHVRDYFVLCMITGPKQHCTKKFTFLSKKIKQPQTDLNLECLLSICFDIEKIAKKGKECITLAFSSEAICWFSEGTIYLCNTSSPFFSQGTSMSQNKANVSPFALSLPPLTLLWQTTHTDCPNSI